MSEQQGVTHEEAMKEDGSQKADIINGRMPLPLVYFIRFKTKEEDKDSDLAKRFHTTPGKIADIRKFSNFAYVNKDFVPTQQHIEQAKAWADKMAERGDDVGAEDVREYLGSLTPATEEQEKALQEAKQAARKPKGEEKQEPEAEAKTEKPAKGKKGKAEDIANAE